MIPLEMGNVARIFAARIVNSLPEGIVIAVFFWLLLRFLPRQNSGTRFAVWFLALLAVAALPFAGGLEASHSLALANDRSQPFLTLSAHWAFIFVIAWLLVASVAILRLAVGIVRVHRLRRTCTAINPAELEPAIAKIVADFSASSSAPVMTSSDEISVPAAIGFLKPAIVVPRWAVRELSPQELNSILLHEFAHLERRDSWTNLLQKVVRAVFCFHPAVWWIERRLSLEREMACDDYVLAETDDPHAYAKCLLALLERNFARRGWAMAQAAVHRAHEATLRLSQILDANRAKSKRVWKPALGVVGIFSFVFLTVLPQTRQLVGFAPNQSAIYESAAARPAPALPAVTSARVVPAALQVGAFPSERLQLNVVRTVNHHKRNLSKRPHIVAAPETLAAKAENLPAAPDVVPVAADQTVAANQNVGTVVETVFVIRTMNQVGGNSWQWNIRVWRLTVVSDRAVNIPVVPNKT